MSRVCVITGGSSGIGLATSMLAARQGYSVAIATLPVNMDAAHSVVRDIRSKGGKAAAIACDVALPGDIESMFRHAESELGPITALVNSAGIYRSSRVDALDVEAVVHMFAVNSIGLMVCCREAARRMSTARGGGGGAIVNVSSMAATIGGRPGASAYAATKGAVDVFTTGFAREVAAEGIRVNVVRPGVTETGLTTHLKTNPELRKRVEASIPTGRIGQPGEVAELIVWLLSDQASLVTGAHVNVGGGGFQVVAVE